MYGSVKVMTMSSCCLVTESVTPLAVDTIGMLNVLDIDNTASGTTNRTKTSTSCEVVQGDLVDQPKQSASAIKAEDPLVEVSVTELQRTDPGPVNTIYNFFHKGADLTEAELGQLSYVMMTTFYDNIEEN